MGKSCFPSLKYCKLEKMSKNNEKYFPKIYICLEWDILSDIQYNVPVLWDVGSTQIHLQEEHNKIIQDQSIKYNIQSYVDD